MSDICCILLDEEIRDVDAHISEKPSERPDAKFCLFQNSIAEYASFVYRCCPYLDCQAGYSARGKNDETDYSHRPRKPQLRLNLVEKDWIDNASDTGSDAHCQGLLCREVSRYRRDSSQKKAPLPKPMQTPWARMRCQRVEQRLVIMMPKTRTEAPAAKRRRG